MPKGVGPVREQDRRAEEPAPVAEQEKGADREERPQDDERRLHRIAAGIARLPLREQGPIIEAEACRVLGDRDVDRGARERCGDDQCQMTEEHVGASSAFAREGAGSHSRVHIYRHAPFGAKMQHSAPPSERACKTDCGTGRAPVPPTDQARNDQADLRQGTSIDTRSL
jgi:hypothetical protein